jgi:hypothetical protein
MLVKVRDVVAEHERVHVLGLDDCCECAGHLSYPDAGGLSFKPGQISYA